MSKPPVEYWVANHPPRPGVCYVATYWRVGVLSAQELTAREVQAQNLMKRMQEAAVEGRSGTLKALTEKLNVLNEGISEKLFSLPLPRGAEVPARAGELRMRLRADACVLGYRMSPAAVSIFLQPIREETVNECAERWFADMDPELLYEKNILQSLTAAQVTEWQRRHKAEATDCTEEIVQTETPFCHTTVLAHEGSAALAPADGKVLVDATLGGGGHSELLLQAGATVWGIDRDPAARAAAKRRLAPYADHLHILAGCFGQIERLLRDNGVLCVDGVLADIGISSPQIDTPQRGFSFSADGPLDMRMDPTSGHSAADIVNTASEEELADILFRYGEERASRAIARKIVRSRAAAPITTTARLSELICTILPRRGRQHPATRSFQALRIAVNDELQELEQLLRGGYTLLRSGGRLAVITFHSLEDRIVKRFFIRVSTPQLDRPEWPAPRPNPEYSARIITRKPIVPSAEEIAANPRSRSAKLRVLEKM